MDDATRGLFDDYNWWRSKTLRVAAMKQRGIPVKDLVIKPEREAALKGMAQWCKNNSVDPSRWLCGLFHIRVWQFAPRWEHLTPKAKTEKKRLARYLTISDMPLFSRRVRERIEFQQDRDCTGYDPNRDMSATTEALKTRYLAEQDPHGCLASMGTGTNGYHPKSLVCGRCPLNQECNNQTQASFNFDVLALRRGEITLQQARAISFARGQYG